MRYLTVLLLSLISFSYASEAPVQICDFTMSSGPIKNAEVLIYHNQNTEYEFILKAYAGDENNTLLSEERATGTLIKNASPQSSTQEGVIAARMLEMTKLLENHGYSFNIDYSKVRYLDIYKIDVITEDSEEDEMSATYALITLKDKSKNIFKSLFISPFAAGKCL